MSKPIIIDTTHDSLIWLYAGLAAIGITLLLTGLAAWVL